MTFRKLKIAFAMVAAISILALGCGQAKDLTAQEVVDKAVLAAASVQTVKMDSDMSMDMDVTGEKPSSMQMDMNMSGSMNVKETEMALTMDANMDIPETGKQTMSTEMYIVDGWMYIKVEAPIVGEQWIKSKLDSNMWAQQNQLAQQIELLKNAIEINSTGTESIDGVSCYVLEVNPNMATLMDFVTSQLGQEEGVDLPDNVDLSEMFKSITIKEWISRDSYLPVKVDMKMVLEINAEDLGQTGGEIDKMMMDMSMVIKYFDYNKPVSIVLPSGAANAKEQSLTK
jgi:hypothetical protein